MSGRWRFSLKENHHGLAIAMMVAVGSLIPWTAYLAIALPGHFRAANWSLAWVGFDSVLMLVLALTAWAAWFERQVLAPLAMVAATLLLCDAWFDVNTSYGTRGDAFTILTATLGNIPLAAYFILLVRHIMLRSAQHLAEEDATFRHPHLSDLPIFLAFASSEGASESDQSPVTSPVLEEPRSPNGGGNEPSERRDGPRLEQRPRPPSPVDRLFHLSVDMLGAANRDGYFALLNPAWTKSLGWSLDELRAQPYITFVHPDDVDATRRRSRSLTELGRDNVIAFENRFLTKSGNYRWLLWHSVVSDDLIFFVVQDTTGQHEERELRRRREEALLESQDFAQGLANSIAEGIFAIDHNGRTTYLNAAAQEMLGWSGVELLGSPIHELIHFERLDGSHLPAEECPIAHTVARGEVVRVECDVFIRRDGTRLPVTYSSSPLHQEDSFGSVVVFDDITQRLEQELRAERELDKLSWIGRIQDALAQDRFVLFAQPILDLRTTAISQHELLIRMRDSNGEMILPGRFLPAAEEFGLIVDIDRWVVHQSAALAAAGHKVEFNLSAKSVGLSMVNTITEAIAATGAPPENLVCEITETALMNDNAVGELFVKGVQKLGCKVALDDFGVGYGGLAYLKRLPVSYLKIDMQFVSDLVEMETSRHVVRAIVDLARGFGACTIAEGPEDQATVEVLRELGVDFVQGCVIAPPGPLGDVLVTS